ncbi:MAG: alpha-D-ribose 1-methylphosphonate 5-triphosphate diphosphatase [Symplocastrum torsivum CPER-KK1]|jgi:alpha-D-ribose 1-methylphosphonate 5-triphosphate diphosphatase|uniref:Alpha-D-ribose 1-methylphosphonate 5-triphosphate diphosphatase n=1 Tax=Symplocastrum torsivum CPER-KK1 TaxID=450513 RepID=A0A951PNH6_9CYAN|nr:alpha-D-ribose 1-methylphosphonate 5-triphosphate diphosphatase [Symplocastrum torsivum CPER-KK1]
MLEKPTAIQGADVLTSLGWLKDTTVVIEEGRFVSIEPLTSPKGATLVDARGLQMLPGIIDLHGDAFERMISPRPGISFPLPMAIAENDCNLIAAGITTFFYSITDSYEPGLRSRDMARQIIEFIGEKNQQSLSCDSRIHIRHEQANIEGHEELCGWLEAGQIDLLSLNDHLPPRDNEKKLVRHFKSLRLRFTMSETEMRALVERMQSAREQGSPQVEQLVAIAHKYEIPIASHDDDTEEKVALSAKRGIAIAEFPATIDLAAKSRNFGAAVLMGAPNLVRGGSHVGYMSVADAVQKGVLDALCSDYHYPSLFHAPFKLAELGLMAFEQAWELVSLLPATAAGIGDSPTSSQNTFRKGRIAIGWDADFLLITPGNSLPSAITGVYVAGQEVARYA